MGRPLLKKIISLRLVLSILNSLAMSVYPTTSATTAPLSLTAPALLTLETDLALLLLRTASVQDSWMCAAKILTSSLLHLPRFLTSLSVVDATWLVLVLGSRASQMESLSLQNGPTCVLSSMTRKRLTAALPTSTSVEAL